jgi:uncharacterized membrane protein YebE (DUF533 family)
MTEAETPLNEPADRFRPANTGNEKAAATRFREGNPGKPKGARNRATQLIEKLFMDEADVEAIARKVVDAAKAGEQWAVTAVLQRIAPPRRSAPVSLKLPAIETAADITTALAAILAAVADGTIDPDEGRIIADIIDAKRRAIETADLEARISKLEKSK